MTSSTSAVATTSEAFDLPPHLLAEIEAGRCVAFVGAGFAAPAVPAWKDLLRGLAARATLTEDVHDWVHGLIDQGAARDLEAAAQIIEISMGDGFDAAVHAVLQETGREDRIADRRRMLAGIPFRAILTTNFDPFLMGEVPGPDAYQRVLRDPAPRWWEPRYWHNAGAGPTGAPVVKLHGEAGPIGSDVVFTQRDYRERLYSSSAYMTFLRSVFATNTMLFIGVSFTDAYLNELRSEILALLDYKEGDDPPSYAILNDVSDYQARYLRTIEGLEVIGFDTDGRRDWSGFDRILRSLYLATNPGAELGAALKGRTVLWVDPDPDDTREGATLLTAAAGEAGGGTEIVVAHTPEEGLAVLRQRAVDVVIADWASAASGVLVAQPLLLTMHAEDLRAPVVIFAGGISGGVDRPAALSLGATAVAMEWPNLFQELVRLLAAED